MSGRGVIKAVVVATAAVLLFPAFAQLSSNNFSGIEYGTYVGEIVGVFDILVALLAVLALAAFIVDNS